MVKYTKFSHLLSEQKAMSENTPLNQEHRKRPSPAGSPKRHDLIAEADRIRAMTAGPLEDSVELLRRDRDGR